MAAIDVRFMKLSDCESKISLCASVPLCLCVNFFIRLRHESHAASLPRHAASNRAERACLQPHADSNLYTHADGHAYTHPDGDPDADSHPNADFHGHAFAHANAAVMDAHAGIQRQRAGSIPE